MADGDNGPPRPRIPAGPWQWQWRRRHRRRRAVGCFLWLVTLILVLLVLSLLFGGWRRGTRDGGGAGLAPVTAIAPGAAVAGAGRPGTALDRVR